MTISEILGISVDELEKMSTEELTEHCKPFLNITRPDRAEKPSKTKTKRKQSSIYSTKNKAFLAGLEKFVETGDIEEARKAKKNIV